MNNKNQVLDLYDNGFKQITISKKLSIHSSYVHNILRLSGKIKSAPCRLSENLITKINKLYHDDGLSVRDIEVKFDLSRYHVRQALNNKHRNHGDSNHIKRVRNAQPTNEYQKQLLLGTLLGDGSISRNKNRGYFVSISHSKKQKEYITHKASILKVKVHEYENNGYSELPLMKMVYKNCATSKYLEKIVLINGKKVVNQYWMNELNEIGIAYWFLDDGSNSFYEKTKKSNLSFHTDNFELEEQQLLINKLKDYGIIAKLHKIKEGKGFRLGVSRKSNSILFEIVKPIAETIPSMMYKIKQH